MEEQKVGLVTSLDFNSRAKSADIGELQTPQLKNATHKIVIERCSEISDSSDHEEEKE